MGTAGTTDDTGGAQTYAGAEPWARAARPGADRANRPSELIECKAPIDHISVISVGHEGAPLALWVPPLDVTNDERASMSRSSDRLRSPG
jgi:hypothetical protein